MLELARYSDRDAVNALALQVHEKHVQWRPDIFEMTQELYSRERFREAIENRELYVAKLGSVVVGYALLNIQNYEGPGLVTQRRMFIDEFCVEQSCRNQGIGKEMMGDVWALAKDFRCTDLQLGVFPQNDEAVAFYQKCGFTIRSIEMQRQV